MGIFISSRKEGKKMRLAEALIERKNINKTIDSLRNRLERVAKVQEGDSPSEDPLERLKALEENLEKLRSIIARINKTNLSVYLQEGTTLMEAIATRDTLALKRSILEDLAREATPARDRFTRTEIKFVPTVSVGGIRKEADKIAKEYRELDAQIQAKNWEAELIE
jgi:hypothetical protein